VRPHVTPPLLLVRSLAPALAPALASALALAAAVPARAVDASAPTEGARRDAVADEIVVEGRRREQGSVFERTPIEVEVLTADQLRPLPVRNVADAVVKLPGIRAQRRVQGQEAAVSIEGMPPEYTRILVDGEQYSGEIGGVGDLRDIPLANVERIEILRGAQALRYGGDAAGGVVHVQTREPPRDGLDGRFDFGGGDDDNLLGSGTVGWGSERLGASLSYVEDQIDGIEPTGDGDAVFVGGNEDSLRVSRDAALQAGWRPLDGLELTSRGGWRREREELVFDSGASGRRDEQRWRFDQAAAWTPGDLAVQGSLFYYGTRLESDIGRRFVLDEEEWKLDAAVEGFLDLGGFTHGWRTGVDARLDRLDLSEEGAGGGSLPPIAPRDEGLERLSLYVIDSIELTGWATLEGGLRTELHSEVPPQLLPQAALLLEPRDDLDVRLSAGRGHRAPSLRDLFQPAVAQLGGAYFLEGNEDLGSETSTSLRLGFDWTPVEGLSLSAVGFYNWIQDHIRSTFDRSIAIGQVVVDGSSPSDRPGLPLICQATGSFFAECEGTGSIVVDVSSPLFKKRNLDSVQTRGAQLRVGWEPSQRVALRVGYTFLDTSLEDAEIDIDEVPNEARHTLDSEASFRVVRTETELALRGRLREGALTETSGTGLFSFSSTRRAPTSFELDLRATQRVSDHLDLFVDFFNLTDERVVDSYVVRGRSFFVGIRGELP